MCSLYRISDLKIGDRFAFTEEGLQDYLNDHPGCNVKVGDIFHLYSVLKMRLWLFRDVSNDKPCFAYLREGDYQVIPYSSG